MSFTIHHKGVIFRDCVPGCFWMFEDVSTVLGRDLRKSFDVYINDKFNKVETNERIKKYQHIEDIFDTYHSKYGRNYIYKKYGNNEQVKSLYTTVKENMNKVKKYNASLYFKMNNAYYSLF